MTDTPTTGAELFVAALQAAGIEVIYGLPGEENTDLMIALKGSSIRFVLTRHEQTAAFMASVYGRLTGRPAGCLATLGPGATNLITGVADATLDFAPLVAITGQGSTDRMVLSESHQVIDLTALFAPVTKQSRTLLHADEIPGAVANAVRIAMAPRPGAVHLSLPEDVAAQPTSATPVPAPARQQSLAHPDTIQTAFSMLSDAKAPMIIAGAGALRSHAAERLAQFAQSHKIPLATTFMAAGILPPDHPLGFGTIGQPFEDHADHAAQDADLILAVGFDPVETSTARFAAKGRPRVLHLAQTPAAADIAWDIVADCVGDIGASLASLSELLGDQHWGMTDRMRAAQNEMRAPRPQPAADTAQILPEDILAVVQDAITADDTVISGVGTHKLKLARSLQAKRPGQLIIANGLAGMGLALPGAMVAAEVQNKGRALAIVGDGEFLMNVQDMETATRLNTPLTVLLWEDGGYGLIETKQEADAGTHSDLSFGNPNWADLCRAFGWQHRPVETFGALADTLAAARSVQGPVLVTVQVDYSEGLEP